VLGYAEEEFVGQNAHGFIHRDDRKSAKKTFLDLVARPGGMARTEYRIRHKDGTWRSMEGVGTNLLRDPAVHAVVLNYRDVTERKKAELESLHLAAIVQSTEDAIIGKKLDGSIVSWNKGAEQLYEYTAGEVIGRSVSILLPPERQHELPDILSKIRTGEPVQLYESERVTKSGRRIDVSVRVSPVYLPTGELIGASAITRDITSRKHAETERELLVAELQHALAEVKTLRGMFPICAWCKKVRDDEGYWNRIESYLESHSEMQFTHGICPDCIEKYHQHVNRQQ
jgi:PAS domain S-box-containing protein